MPNSTHTSRRVSCIPEAYLVHRSEGGEVENLDISLYISTFLTIMHTMHTLHTFLEKVYMMKVRESKRNKKVLWYKKIFIPQVSSPATDSSGVCRYAGMHGGEKRLNKHIFHTIFQTRILCTYLWKKLHLASPSLPEVIAHIDVTLGVYNLFRGSTYTSRALPITLSPRGNCSFQCSC